MANTNTGPGAAYAGGSATQNLDELGGYVSARQKRDDDEWQSIIERMRGGGYDQETADNYYESQRGDIDKTFSDQARSVAADYARRGLGSSGLSAGAQTDVALKAAAQRRQARLKAIQQATQDRQSNLSGELSAIGAKHGIALGQAQQSAQNDAANAAALSSLMQLGFGAAGLAMLSDERLKSNIIRYDVEALPGVPFASWSWTGCDDSRHYGVIAQDVEKVRPDLVVPMGPWKGVNYSFLLMEA